MNGVLEAEELPAACADLNPSLANVNAQTFSLKDRVMLG
ncbi:unnamed protein product [Protopolystoma xenopodis]|uniref:Uncharacterized protein n=1 Tax=Protopolystoma xenopodis TaxID=117903 RepID=A0A448XNH9_9PLAT|nr:unnamed protein product [Protopolystoma xenopodis]